LANRINRKIRLLISDIFILVKRMKNSITTIVWLSNLKAVGRIMRRRERQCSKRRLTIRRRSM
jgi:hypothetical protein